MKIAIAVIHGIGNQPETFANTFMSKINSSYFRLTGLKNLVFEPIWWKQHIAPIEQVLSSKISNLGWKTARNFFVNYAGDALCYQPEPGVKDGFYDMIHKSVDEVLVSLASRVESDAPLCIIGHSLGTVVTSNFIWDSQNANPDGFSPSKEAVALINRLELLYTMGCPLATWGMRYPNGGVPIEIPKAANWYNLYDNNDVISSPIKLINQQYQCMPNLFDVKVNVGSLTTKWSPLCHTGYWDSKEVINHIVSKLIDLNKYYSSQEALK